MLVWLLNGMGGVSEMVVITIQDIIGLSILALFVLAFGVAYSIEKIKEFWSKK